MNIYFFLQLFLVLFLLDSNYLQAAEIQAVTQQPSIQPQNIYSGLVGGTLQALIQQVLILGIFIVGIGHVTHGIKKAQYFSTPLFRQRLILVCVVILFVTFMKLTYSVEWGLSFESMIQQARATFEDAERHRAALMVVLLIPIDLTTIVLLAGMFLVLAVDESSDDKSSESGITIHRELRNLYLLTGSTHFAMILWWIFFNILTDGIFNNLGDIMYHVIFVSLHATGYTVLKKSTNSKNKITSWISNGNLHVCFYSFITLSVYVSRLWMYVFRYTQPTG
ncbi:MAG: hypothetical protein D3921_07865 [Candidatus Electrothrix sp. AW1]|nr:hypothetical protein [Candidatus Electrothrix sp. AX1]MCI5182417.1 hypothetical protein [Candidatus Electrothrix gigas]